MGLLKACKKNKSQPEVNMKFYNEVYVPAFLYDSESWTLTKANRREIQMEIKICKNKIPKISSGCTGSNRKRKIKIQDKLNIKLGKN